VFDWTKVAGAAGYVVQVSENDQFIAPSLLLQSVGEPWLKADLPVAGPLLWRVGAVDRAGAAGPWSTVRKLEILPPPLAACVFGIVIAPASVAGGTQAVGLVTVAESAPPGGATVTLWSSDPAAAVPPRVLFPSGRLEAGFTVSTRPVSAVRAVTISASSMGDPRTATLTAGVPRHPVRLHSLRVNPAVLAAGSRAAGTVALAGPAPAATTIRLAAADRRISLPTTVTIPAGAHVASFPVQTAHDNSPARIVVTAAGERDTETTTVEITSAASMNALPPPSPTLPPGGAFLGRQMPVEFAWSDVMGAAASTLEVDDSPAFGSPLVRTVPGSRVSIHPLPPGTAWWRIRANDHYRAPGRWLVTRAVRVR
jgi:hypothetical protein